MLYQLNYTHHIGKDTLRAGVEWTSGRVPSALWSSAGSLARQKGLEPPAHCLEGSCSIQLSYWRVWSG